MGNDQSQFAEAFVRNQRRIYAYITTLLANRDDAEEVFQQTSLILWRKWDQYDQDREFVSWACGIAHNEVRNFYRRAKRREVMLSEQVIEELAARRLESERFDDSRHKALSVCLAQLEGAQRELLERCYAGAKSAKNVASQLGMTSAAMYMKLHRIRRRLMECIDRRVALEQS